jgi:hypothetical protein
MPPSRQKTGALTLAQAEEIAANALAFLAEDAHRLGRFIAATGVTPDELRRAATSPQKRAAVLDHLAGDESLLLVFAASYGVAAATVGPARDVLAAGPDGADP